MTSFPFILDFWNVDFYLFSEAQFALDTIMVSPLYCELLWRGALSGEEVLEEAVARGW